MRPPRAVAVRRSRCRDSDRLAGVLEGTCGDGLLLRLVSHTLSILEENPCPCPHWSSPLRN